ncbi:MetQ/NlpA family ABC transporter substrate-binding protein [Pseudonocardia acaciae]|uniref:MetQ/NlpA family ABC transporter substrate-binding protein n=1 Tax=Pseudonocardia acaciae TaxID=551276 RepID=UPI00048F2945|nr:MetQ/NlpA family ABC transporter substrate-binding protein [Pseudonocardia acaciae]
MKRTSRPKGLFLAVVAIAVAVSAACSAPGSSSSATTVKIGVANAQQGFWQVFQRKAKDQGIDVQLVNFTDYNQPNPALSQNQLQLNEFQHMQYLANYNVRNHDTLRPIGATAVYPLPLYSRKHRSVAEVPAGGQIAIPNDPTNQARALLVLQAAKLITLKGGGNALSTPNDIDTAASKVTVVPVDAAQTAANLPSVDGAVTNNDYATPAGLGPNDTIFTDDPNSAASKPYINVFVARDQDKNNPTYLKLVQIYHDPEVEAAAKKDLGATTVFKNNDAADLQATTAALEDTIRKTVG